MTEEIRQRALVDGLKLLDRAFVVLRDPLEIDDKDDVGRPEVKIALMLREAKEALYEFVLERQRRGIKAAPGEN